MKKQEKGITLIALVITIIVLLLLAGISIAMLTGENGILTKANKAKEETKKAQYEENLKLIGLELQTEKIQEKLNSEQYMNRYENRIEEEFNQNDLWEGAKKSRTDKVTILVITKEEWIYRITEEKVEYLGSREENPAPPSLEKANINFSYNPSDWTKENVTVIITTELEGFHLQYAVENPEAESSWENYPIEGIEMANNGEVYARLINNLNETGEFATGKVSNIDRTPPSVQVTLGTVTTNSIQINVTASDNSNQLAINDTYQYYLNGNFVTNSTNNSYTFSGLSSLTSYTVGVKVKDKAGNESEKKNIEAKTMFISSEGLLKQLSTYSINENGKICKNAVKATINNSSSTYQYQVEVTTLKGDIVLDGVNKPNGLTYFVDGQSRKMYSVGNESSCRISF